jgi:hypothetical protein
MVDWMERRNGRAKAASLPPQSKTLREVGDVAEIRPLGDCAGASAVRGKTRLGIASGKHWMYFSRFIFHASRFTPHVSRLTIHASRFTPHASRLTFQFAKAP